MSEHVVSTFSERQQQARDLTASIRVQKQHGGHVREVRRMFDEITVEAHVIGGSQPHLCSGVLV
jgi:hypothetical protein